MLLGRLVELLGGSDNGAARGSLLAAACCRLQAHWREAGKQRRGRLSYNCGSIVESGGGLQARGRHHRFGWLSFSADSKLHHFLFFSVALLKQPFQEPMSRRKRLKIQRAIFLFSPLKFSDSNAIGPCSLLWSTSIPWFATSFFSGKEDDSCNIKVSVSGVGRGGSHIFFDGGPKNGRFWTNCILALNALIFIAQTASQGRLLLLGAKVNSLIDKGQMWRLLTPALLHANLGHLLVNSYSLNSIGPTVETLEGPKRFLAVYAASALTSSTLSYYLCKAPSVGASGAIFGLVGAFAVFIARHKNMLSGGQDRLSQVARVIILNMVFGLVTDGIDNWGHLGGLLGGGIVAWLVGPAFGFESRGGRRKLLVDRPPISYLLQKKNRKNS